MKIAVIGAGAGGLMGALGAARSQNNQVVLLERNDGVGRKLLVTGGGRCNITNEAMTATSYVCPDRGWMEEFLRNWGVGELVDLFATLGIPVQKTDDGWYYPLSESALSVVAILEQRLQNANVDLRVATIVKQIRRHQSVGEGFILAWQEAEGLHEEAFDRVMVAAGGRAYPDLGSKGELFSQLERLGHTVSPQVPALGPIYLRLGAFKVLQGLRFDVVSSIYEGDHCLGTSRGNVIVTEKGLNGPGAMNLSHWVGLNAGHQLHLRLHFDFVDSGAFQAVAKLPGQTLLPLLEAFLPPKAASWLIQHAWLQPEDLATPANLEKIKQSALLSFEVTGAGDFTRSQVSVGGVLPSEVSSGTCESRVVPGLYLVGETLNVAGPCGGFNLHFAFGSGYLAGSHLASINPFSKERI